MGTWANLVPHLFLPRSPGTGTPPLTDAETTTQRREPLSWVQVPNLNHFFITVSSQIAFVNQKFFHYSTQPPESFPFYLLISAAGLLPTPEALSSSPHNSVPGSRRPRPTPMITQSPILMSSNSLPRRCLRGLSKEQIWSNLSPAENPSGSHHPPQLWSPFLEPQMVEKCPRPGRYRICLSVRFTLDLSSSVHSIVHSPRPASPLHRILPHCPFSAG